MKLTDEQIDEIYSRLSRSEQGGLSVRFARAIEAEVLRLNGGGGEATPKATLFHDSGAIAQCGKCQRYTLDRKALSDRQPICTCGEQHYWSGSFKPPTENSEWHGPAPVKSKEKRCRYCDNTGDVHRADGEWLGTCTECDSAPQPHQAAPGAVLEAVAIVTGHTLDGPMLVWTGEGVHVGDALYTKPKHPTPVAVPDGLLKRAEDLHEKAGIPWAEAEKLALSEAGIEDCHIDEISGNTDHATICSLLSKEEVREFTRTILIYGQPLIASALGAAPKPQGE